MGSPPACFGCLRGSSSSSLRRDVAGTRVVWLARACSQRRSYLHRNTMQLRQRVLAATKLSARGRQECETATG
eukprot:6240051-Prymnesium_polylepis.1